MEDGKSIPMEDILRIECAILPAADPINHLTEAFPAAWGGGG